MLASLQRMCERFEIAVGNFGRSCISMRANEKAFQAWYAASVIQEFGLARVYREVHFWKSEIAPYLTDNPMFDFIRKGNEVFPDLSVSWEPDVDARHSSTRDDSVKCANKMIQQFGILSELKVTGSTGIATSLDALRQDLAKLAAFLMLHKNSNLESVESDSSLAAYMVILDNHQSEINRSSVADERTRVANFLDRTNQLWPVGTVKPYVLVVRLVASVTAVDTYRDFVLEGQ